MNNKFYNTLLLATMLFASSANGAPVAYSINSDSGDVDTMDSLYKIDLSTGNDEHVGTLWNGLETRIDTEGLAFAPDGTLWGIDDESHSLFPINKESGVVSFRGEVSIPRFNTGGGNDFGMTFDCDGILYVSSVRSRTVYRQNLDGSSDPIGEIGALGVNISAIAAYGNPTRLFGLGNGQFQNGDIDAPNLYSIDLESGVATEIGPLGAEAGEYNQGGLAFDADGTLWAITDRGVINNTIANLPSQVLRIDENTGAATLVSETSQVGYESLTIAPPAGCEAAPPPPPPVDEEVEPIPTLGPVGRLLAVVMLLLGGMVILRRRVS